MMESHTEMSIIAITEQGEACNEDIEDPRALAGLGLLQIPVLILGLRSGILHLHDGITGRVLHCVN